MLSRFSKLPVVSSLFQYNNDYPQEIIDAVISEIKKLGRYSNNNDDTLQGITKILSLMKKYNESLHVQRVSCHALSNLAMQVHIARWIVQKGGFGLIKKALLKFENDHKLCWLGSSAIWNLARPPANRSIIGQQGVSLMIKMLKIHQNKEKVTNTSIGALSNLSLCDHLKTLIAKQENIKLILSVLNNYHKCSLSVATSGAGLIANLAVSDDFASILVEKGAISLLLKLLQWTHSNTSNGDDTLYRNTCAALNNMVTAQNFLDVFLENCGVEAIFKFLKHNQNDLYTNLLENCLVSIEVDINQETTSLHLCSLHGRLNILKKMMKLYPFTDLNATDSKKMTVLDYAIMTKNNQIIAFLSKVGATKYQQNLLMDNDNDKEIKEIKAAMNNGKTILKTAHYVNQIAISKSLPSFPTDLCKLMVTYNNNVDMLHAINQYV